MKRNLAKRAAVFGFSVWFALNPADIRVYATETQIDESVSAGDEEAYSEIESVAVQTEARDNEIISVILPLVEDRDPFGFFIDPLNIFYNTFEKRNTEDDSSSSSIHVEEGTNLLFYNRNGDYTLSSRSDLLTIINQSTVPVDVTITARLDDLGNINIMQDTDFEGRDSCDLYLALIDSAGNEVPLSAEGEASICIRMQRAPIAAYAYELDEDSGEYRYVHQSEEVEFDTYSFGLKGACNKAGDWTTITGNPHISVSWEVEPILPDEQDRDTSSDSSSEGDDPDISTEDVTDHLKDEDISDDSRVSDRSADETDDDITEENPATDTEMTTDETGTAPSDRDVPEDSEEKSEILSPRYQ